MKQFRILSAFVLTAAFVVLSAAQTKSIKPQLYKKLQYPKLKEIVIPEPARVELANGMIVYLLEDHTLPTISASVMVKTGSRYEPTDKVGLAGITGQVMRTGGTTTKTGDDIDQVLERAAASVETFIGTTSGGARMNVLREDIDLGLSTLADILRNPQFRDDKIELAKIQAKSGISRRNDQVQGIADREYSKLLYGAGSPYARMPEYESIENITRQDLVDFHKKYFFPNNLMISFWGDFKNDEMKAKVEKYFGDWAKGTVTLPPVPQPRKASMKTVNFVKKTDVNQSNIYIGHLGGKLNDPESPFLNLADVAFGGGFASRLFVKVRTQMGLAYSVGSRWGESWDYPGRFQMSGSTKSGTTVAMIEAIIAELNDVIKNGITDADLNYAKDSYLNSYVFEFESKANVINKLMSLEFYGYPKDYYQKQFKDIQGATRAAVNEAIQKRWDSEKLTILVVGNDAEFGTPLSNLGTVKEIDITIPAPPEKFPEATAGLTTKGKDLLRKALAAVGGQKYTDIKDMTENVTMKMQSAQMGEMEMSGEMTIVFPNKIFNKMSTSFGDVTMAWDGKGGWMSMGAMGVQDMPGSQAEAMQRQLTFNPVMVMKNLESPDFTIWYYQEEKVADKPAGVVLVKHNASGKVSKWYLDAQSSLLVKTSSRERGPQGPANVETFYEDYKEVSGVRFPHKVKSLMDGKPASDITMTGLKINTGVKEDIFKKP